MQAVLVLLSFAAGVALRWAYLGHTTTDTFDCLLPWYDYSLQHGWAALATAYTNYTPFYSYLLILATRLDGLVGPLALIKGISFVFELAMALLAYGMVRRIAGASQGLRSAAAFACVWLAPTVIANGAGWGQADALWTFFVMLTVAIYCSGRNGIAGFGVAVAIKAQAVFLGPFVLGVALRRRLHWLWFAVVPAAYLILALPVLIAGRSLVDVASVYLGQARTFHHLAMNVANLWVFVPNELYAAGVVIGLVVAALAGCVLAAAVATSKRRDPRTLMLFACTALLAMPFLLPKMHDRYFYAFEIASIMLACIDVRFIAMAIIAQVDGIYAYGGFEGLHFGLPIAAVSNGILLVWLIRVIRAGGQVGSFSWAPLMLYAAFVAGAAALLPAMESGAPSQLTELAYWLSFVGVVVQASRLLPKIESVPRPQPSRLRGLFSDRALAATQSPVPAERATVPHT